MRRWWARQRLAFAVAFRHAREAAEAGMPVREAMRHGVEQSGRAVRKEYDKP